MLRTTFCCILTALVGVTANAQSLAGRFLDANLNPIGNVGVILSNGAGIGTSAADGTFLVTGLRDRVYTVQIDPHSNFLQAAGFDLTVSGATTLGDYILGPAFPVTATMVNESGAGLLGVNMNVYLPNGVKLYTPHDGSDAAGNVVIGIPANTNVILRAIPPTGSNLVPWEQPTIATAPVAKGTITLRAGYAVTGSVVDTVNLLPIAGCEVITTNALTGEVVLQLNKLTNTLGAFSALLPFGLYDVEIVPPLGNLHAGRQVFGIPVLNAPYNMGLVRMLRAVQLSGQVIGPAGGVLGADIDVFDTLGHKLYTPNDNTSATGLFGVMVPPGTYQIRVDPLVATGLTGTRTGNYTVATNLNVGVIPVTAGIAMNITVHDAFAQPIPAAQLQLIDPATGNPIVVPGNQAGADGVVHCVAPAGTWNLRISAPQGSLAAPLVQNGYSINAPTTSTMTLPVKDIMTDLDGLEVLTAPNGSTLYVHWTFFNTTAQTRSIYLDAVAELDSGVIVPWIPDLPLDFPPQIGLTLYNLPIPMPIVPANELGFVQHFVVRIKDPVTLQIIDQAAFRYVPQ